MIDSTKLMQAAGAVVGRTGSLMVFIWSFSEDLPCIENERAKNRNAAAAIALENNYPLNE